MEAVSVPVAIAPPPRPEPASPAFARFRRKLRRIDFEALGLVLSVSAWSLLWLQALLQAVVVPQPVLAVLFFAGLAAPGLRRCAGRSPFRAPRKPQQNPSPTTAGGHT